MDDGLAGPSAQGSAAPVLQRLEAGMLAADLQDDVVLGDGRQQHPGHRRRSHYLQTLRRARAQEVVVEQPLTGMANPALVAQQLVRLLQSQIRGWL